MKNKVKITVAWSEKGVELTTDRGRKWVLKASDVVDYQFSCKNMIGYLAQALLQVTFANWIERTEACKVAFTLTAEDVIES